MATVTESDPRELNTLILAFREETNQRLTRLEKGQPATQLEVVVIRSKLEIIGPAFQKLLGLAEKMSELKNWQTPILILLTAIMSTFLSGILGYWLGGNSM